MNTAHSIEEQPPKKEIKESVVLSELLKKIEGAPSEEEKLRMAIDFMRSTLSQSKTAPYFKNFWEVRKLCLPLFKESGGSMARKQMWEEYVELTREGRRLKNLLDEESAFAVEQIEIAIQSLVEEVEGFYSNPELAFAKMPSQEFPEGIDTLKSNYGTYRDIQQKLVLLNVFASRVHSLRKELIKTEMRIRSKTKFFERLSELGDRIFPLRKDLIKDVSQLFMDDIHSFVQSHFADEVFNHDEMRRNVFFFRDEIKALQSFAKLLTLNTKAFTTTRENLSFCWDKLKGMEREIKQEQTAHRAESNENMQQVMQRIAAVKEKKLPPHDALKEYDDILREMRGITLMHHDVKALKEEIRVAKLEPEAQINAELDLKKQKDAEVEEKKRALVASTKGTIESLKEMMHKMDVQQLSSELAKCREEVNLLQISKREKVVLERSLKEVRDFLENKKEETLINLSADDKAALTQLQEILRQRQQRRGEIKAQIEEYRKIMGGSTLDFEKAIEFGELMASEKERLEKMDESISEIENKISDLKHRSLG